MIFKKVYDKIHVINIKNSPKDFDLKEEDSKNFKVAKTNYNMDVIS